MRKIVVLLLLLTIFGLAGCAPEDQPPRIVYDYETKAADNVADKADCFPAIDGACPKWLDAFAYRKGLVRDNNSSFRHR